MSSIHLHFKLQSKLFIFLVCSNLYRHQADTISDGTCTNMIIILTIFQCVNNFFASRGISGGGKGGKVVFFMNLQKIFLTILSLDNTHDRNSKNENSFTNVRNMLTKVLTTLSSSYLLVQCSPLPLTY